jgi:Putative zinc-finger/Anti-sigma-K factor rskA
MRPEECREWRERIGALVLGQLPEDERFAVEAHLEGCPACRAEAEVLGPVAAILSRADPDRLTHAPAPPPRLGERIARRIAAERRSQRRRRTRVRLGLGAAVAAAAATALAVIVIASGSSESPPSETVAFRSLPQGVSVGATLAPRPWGSDVRLQVRGFRPGTLCQVWVRRSDGQRVPAGSFRYVYDGESDEADLSSGVTPADATAIGLRAGSKTFVAPLPRHAAGTDASLIPTTRQQEEAL